MIPESARAESWPIFWIAKPPWVLAGAKRRRETQPEDDDGASRLVGMPERESPKLVRSRFRSRSCGDSPGLAKANPAAGLQGGRLPLRGNVGSGEFGCTAAARTCYLNARLPRLQRCHWQHRAFPFLMEHQPLFAQVPVNAQHVPQPHLLGRQKVRQRIYNVPLNRPLQMPRPILQVGPFLE